MNIETPPMTIDGYPFHCERVDARPSEDCGCPEEVWLIGSLEVTIHFEEDGEAHIFVDAGDWDADKFVSVESMAELRTQAAEWINTFPIEQQHST